MLNKRRSATVAPRGWGLAWLLSASLAGSALAQEQPPPAVSVEPERFSLRGFGNVDFAAAGADDVADGFRLGALDLYMSSSISDRFSALAELVFESDGGELVTDLERLTFSYEPWSHLRLDLGRMHSPIVLWNVHHHHGVYLDTPIERPAMARFEDHPGAWPLHFVGLTASGQVTTGGSLRYLVGAGNGRGEVLDSIEVAGNTGGGSALITSMSFAPVLGWELTASGYFDTIPAPSGTLRERDYTFSTAYLRQGFELQAEWARMNHSPVDGGETYRTTGYYVLASRRLPGRLDKLRPYLLFDHLDVAQGEAFLAGVSDEESWTAGVRFDPRGGAALKVEYRSQKSGDTDRASVFQAQAAFAF